MTSCENIFYLLIMILKTYSRKQPKFRQLIHYITEDRQREHTNDLFFQLCHNVSARSIEDVINDFQENDQYRKRRKNGNACYHTILSFAPDDTQKITKTMLWNIAQTFIQFRDSQALYLIQPHQDKDHIHLHCCISGNQFHSQKATRLSRPQFYQLRVGLEQFQQRHYPQLNQSLIYNRMAAFEITRLKKLIEPLYEKADTSKEFLKNIHKLPTVTYDKHTKTITHNHISFPLSDLSIDLTLLKRLDQLHAIEQHKRTRPDLEIPF